MAAMAVNEKESIVAISSLWIEHLVQPGQPNVVRGPAILRISI